MISPTVGAWFIMKAQPIFSAIEAAKRSKEPICMSYICLLRETSKQTILKGLLEKKIFMVLGAI